MSESTAAGEPMVRRAEPVKLRGWNPWRTTEHGRLESEGRGWRLRREGRRSGSI